MTTILDQDYAVREIMRDAKRRADDDERTKHRTYLDLRRRIAELNLTPAEYERSVRAMAQELRY